MQVVLSYSYVGGPFCDNCGGDCFCCSYKVRSSCSTYLVYSFCSEYVGDNFILIMQLGISVAIVLVVFSAVHYMHDCYYCNYAGDYFCYSYELTVLSNNFIFLSLTQGFQLRPVNGDFRRPLNHE